MGAEAAVFVAGFLAILAAGGGAIALYRMHRIAVPPPAAQDASVGVPEKEATVAK